MQRPTLSSLVLSFAMLASQCVHAAPGSTASPTGTTSTAAPAASGATEPSTAGSPVANQLARALELIDNQQQQLDQQGEQLASATTLITQQGERIDRLEASLDELRSRATELGLSVDTVAKPGTPGRAHVPAAAPQAPSAPPAGTQSTGAIASGSSNLPTTDEDTAADASDAKIEDDPARVILESLPGATRLPGTDIVMRWGGYVKNTIVNSFDPLTTTDRFITGAIPVDNTQDVQQQATITAAQSRLNLDMREPTNVGLLRAFVEGDFAGDGNTFRLRHAFGQRGNVLAGQTWSTFVDQSATPEEVDFEGLNGRINVRQPQVRVQPGLFSKYELMVSIESPNAEVTNGTGVSEVPDFVVAGRVNWGNRMHMRIATVLRQIRAQDDADPNTILEEFGWGTSFSGRVDLPWLEDRDALLFQLNVGKGYGRYVNDLNTVGSFDGYITTEGELKLIDVLSGYVAYRHRWNDRFRSNAIFGFVGLDNPNEVPGDFYKRTYRASTNLFWSPTRRFDVGAELLWGMREDEDGQRGFASQFQLAAKYLF